MIRAVFASGRCYELFGQHLTYADDMALIAESPEEMRVLLRSAEDAAAAVGLTFNPTIAATLYMGKGWSGIRPQRTQLEIQVETMWALDLGVAYEHPGTPTGFQVQQTPFNTIGELITDSHVVDRSLLFPWQKLETIATFILPWMDFCLRVSDVRKQPLKEADRQLKKIAKGWMNLPQLASAELVFLAPSSGGEGLLPLADMRDVLTIVHTFKLLSCKGLHN